MLDLRRAALLAALLLVTGAVAIPLTPEAASDRITDIPHLSDGPLPFDMYGGYLTVNASSGRNLHYFFVESANDPASAPIIGWWQGGPGCSSSIGMMLENGPFQPSTDGTGVERSFYSWNRIANVLYIDSPAGVGFSYSDTPSDYKTNNNRTADDNYRALQLFFERFPQYKTNDLWLSGESYAGDYVPQLAYRIVHGADAGLAQAFAGMLVGNPVISCQAWKEQAPTIQIELFYWHGMIPRSARQSWFQAGCDAVPPPSSCSALSDKITAMVGEFDPDNMYTNPVTGNASLSIGPVYEKTLQKLNTEYLNLAEVQKAFHARPTNWTACCSEPGQSGGSCELEYTNNWTNMIPYYDDLFANRPDLRVLIYSGNTDIATVPFAYTELCLDSMARPVVQQWSQWHVHQQRAGYVEVRDRYTFATVRSGHEVPMFAPEAGFELVSRFIKGTLYEG